MKYKVLPGTTACRWVLFGLALFAAAAPAWAHRVEAPPPATATAAGPAGSDVHDHTSAAAAEWSGVLPPDQGLLDLLTDHVHNKLVHFPLAYGLGAALLLLLLPWWPGALQPARVLLVLGLFGGVAAMVAGNLQAEAHAEHYPLQTLDWHAMLGMAAVLAMGLNLWLTGPGRRRDWRWPAALLLAALTASAGLLGSVLGRVG